MTAIAIEAGPVAVESLIGAIAECRAFIGSPQIRMMTQLSRGEEGDWFKGKYLELAKLFRTMPKVYEQDSLGERAIVHLHYFKGSGDWYITERDTSRPQHQAYGMADLGDGGEVGYISILELIRSNVEIDLHWKPITLGEVRKKREARSAA